MEKILPHLLARGKRTVTQKFACEYLAVPVPMARVLKASLLTTGKAHGEDNSICKNKAKAKTLSD